MLACCAFAVFLLSQILWPFAALRDRLWGRRAPRANPAAAWSLGDAAAASPERYAAVRPALAAVVLLEAAVIGGSLAFVTFAGVAAYGQAQHRLEAMVHGAVCRAFLRSPS